MITNDAAHGADAQTMERTIRGWNDVLLLWRLCRNGACMRAKACRGEAQSCLQSHFALLPEGVRAWFAGVGEAQEEGLDFDAAMDWLDTTPAGEAFAAWQEAVRGSLRPPSRARPQAGQDCRDGTIPER